MHDILPIPDSFGFRMSYRLPPLNGLRAFEAAARHLSFTRAADELGVHPSRSPCRPACSGWRQWGADAAVLLMHPGLAGCREHRRLVRRLQEVVAE